MKKIRCIAAILAAVMLIGGCATTTNVKQSQSSDEDLSSYPLKGDLTFTCWRQMDANLSTSYSNQAESPFEKELAKRTGVTIEYQHPAAGSVQESFNILISSGDLPDMIYYPWDNMVGGASKAIADGHIKVITEYMDKYTPAYKRYLSEHADVDRAVRTEQGEYFGLANIKGDDILCTSAGLMVRKDWLDELGLPEPETMDEIYTVLKAMKEQKGVELPYSGDLYQAALWGIFTSAYGVLPELYVEGNQVLFGSVEPAYKEYLTTMHKWYAEGLIDSSFATLDSKTINSNIMNGFSAMTNGAGGSGMGVYLNTAKTKDPNYDLVALKTPVLNKGDKPMYGNYSPKVSGHYVAVTNACENVPAVLKYLDYKYTEEGHMLSNFGIEGVSYEMKDGEPIYTDFILNNSENKSVSQMMAQYMLSSSVGGAFVGDGRYIMQYYKLDQQKDALKKWSDTDASKHVVPKVNIAEDQLADVTRMLTDIITYSQSMTLKFIMGTEELANYDKFVAELKSMGLDTVLLAYTEALDRYYKK